jgi:hypothetical protein
MNNSITSQNAALFSAAAYDAVTSIDSYVQMAGPAAGWDDGYQMIVRP